MRAGDDGGWRRERIVSAGAVLLLHAAALWLLLAARPDAIAVPLNGALATFTVRPDPPPPPPAAHVAAAPHRAGAAAPAGRRARPKPVVAPKPVVTPPPTPVLAAPVAGTGAAPDAGAAAAGDGTGAGGVGTGTGAGGAGNGTGGGGGGSGARLLSGAIRDRDYPKGAREARTGGSVTVRFTVGTDGRARDCAVLRSSGDATLDATTCRLIADRFRYAPATDAGGRPVAEVRGWRQDWWLEKR